MEVVILLMIYLQKYVLRIKQSMNVKVFKVLFKTMTKIDEAKTVIKHISCDSKCKFNSAAFQIKRGRRRKGQCECKIYCECKTYHSWNPTTYNCKNGKYLQSIIDKSVIMSSEIINVRNNMTTNVKMIVSINFDYKMDYCIFHMEFICYHYAKHRSK